MSFHVLAKFIVVYAEMLLPRHPTGAGAPPLVVHRENQQLCISMRCLYGPRTSRTWDLVGGHRKLAHSIAA